MQQAPASRKFVVRIRCRPFLEVNTHQCRQLAVDLALRCNGEVVNGDALQLYEGLPILTNKIKLEERRGIPHHLLGCVNVKDRPWTARGFVSRASDTIDEIHSRSKLPIVVGGSHYYLQSLLFHESFLDSDDGSQTQSPQQPSVPEERLKVLDAPTDVLLQELKKVDPIMAGRWHPNDRRKIQRSLEIFLRTGETASSHYGQQSKRQRLRFPTLIFWTHTDKTTLNSRLAERVCRMKDEGLFDDMQDLEHVRRAIETDNGDFDESYGIWTAIGYKEFRPLLTMTLETAASTAIMQQTEASTNDTVTATRQYAQRQIRWIRIKLANALHESLPVGKMFVLNTTDPQAWQTSVVDPAVNLSQAFIEGTELPAPEDVYPGARELLQPKRDYDMGQRRDLWEARVCELCDKTLMGQDQWQSHISSRKHKQTVKAKSKTGTQD